MKRLNNLRNRFSSTPVAPAPATPPAPRKHRASALLPVSSDYGVLIHLKRAEGLPSADSNGKSDPLVKFYINGRGVGRSSTVFKTLEPAWKEDIFFPVAIEELGTLLKLEVWDYDRGAWNDYLGEVELNLDAVFGFQVSSLLAANKAMKPYELLQELSRNDPYNFELELLNKRPAKTVHHFKQVNNLVQTFGGILNNKSRGNSNARDKRKSNRKSRFRSRYSQSHSSAEYSSSVLNSAKTPEHVANQNPLLESETTYAPAGRIFFSLRIAKKQAMISKPKWEVRPEDSVAKQLVVDLIGGKDLAVMDTNGKSDPYCWLNFQGKRSKSKVVYYTTNPEWRERFDFPYNSTHNNDIIKPLPLANDAVATARRANKEHELFIELYDRDGYTSKDDMGEASLNVMELVDQYGGPNDVWLPVNIHGQPAGYLHLVVSILDVLAERPLTMYQQMTYPASLKLYIVQALKSKSGKNKKVCYVEVQVGKAKLRTQPVEDSRNPKFERILELPVKDIFSVAEVSLYEKRYDAWDEPAVLVGKISFLVTDMVDREVEWHLLKDKELERAVNAQIRFGCHLKKTFSSVRALLKPKDVNPIEQRAPPTIEAMWHEIKRIMVVRKEVQEGWKAVMGVLSWNYGFWPTIGAMVITFLFLTLYRDWFLPFVGLAGLLYTRRNSKLYDGNGFEVDENGEILPEYAQHGATTKLDADMRKMEDEHNAQNDIDEGGDAEPEEAIQIMFQGAGVVQGAVQGAAAAFLPQLTPLSAPNDESTSQPAETSLQIQATGKKPKKTLMEKLSMPRNVIRTIQHVVGDICDYYERLIGFVTWSNPLLTYYTTVGLALAAILLFFVPLRIVIMVALEWQFIRRGLRKYGIAFAKPPHFQPYIPLLEILKRVPTSSEKRKYARVRPTEDVQGTLTLHNFPLRDDLTKSFRKSSS